MSLPTVQMAAESEQWLSEQVHAPAFFEKLAAAGIEPRSQAEARQLLTMGSQLYQLEQDGQYKTAAAEADETPNPFLAHCLDRLGVDSQQHAGATRHQEAYVKQAALETVRHNPIALHAGLVYDHVVRGGELAEDAEPTQKQAGEQE